MFFKKRKYVVGNKKVLCDRIQSVEDFLKLKISSIIVNYEHSNGCSRIAYIGGDIKVRGFNNSVSFSEMFSSTEVYDQVVLDYRYVESIVEESLIGKPNILKIGVLGGLVYYIELQEED